MATTQLRILLVDDEQSFREVSAAVLQAHGHWVRTAGDGFEALRELKQGLFDIVISDLRMPSMSGFELLSVVRKRFPHIGVIATSGEFTGTDIPTGVIADAFFEKGHYSVEELTHKIADMMMQYPIRPHLPKCDTAPVWVARTTKDYLILTCTECLRSFPVSSADVSEGVREAVCDFCGANVRYRIDETLLRFVEQAAD
jgi:CheY-like chemotaxis protein